MTTNSASLIVTAILLFFPSPLLCVNYNASSVFIHPKTKWCGMGTTARTYAQLGSAFETDQCCRDHDHCQRVINPFQTRYGYTSIFHFTISHCECDVSFYYCLRRSKDTEGQSVIDWFFRLVRMPCFVLVNRTTCLARDTRGRCLRNSTGQFADLRRLPFFYNNDLEGLVENLGRAAFRAGTD